MAVQESESSAAATGNRETWSQQAPWIAKERAIPALLNECRLLLAIQGLAHNGSHVCNASLNTLAAVSGIPKSTLPSVTRDLEMKGYIEIEQWGYHWNRRTRGFPKKYGRVQYVLCWTPERHRQYRQHAPERNRKAGTFGTAGAKGHETPF
jgi:hypothetical protein